jgi:hypothetical protein
LATVKQRAFLAEKITAVVITGALEKFWVVRMDTMMIDRHASHPREKIA